MLNQETVNNAVQRRNSICDVVLCGFGAKNTPPEIWKCNPSLTPPPLRPPPLVAVLGGGDCMCSAGHVFPLVHRCAPSWARACCPVHRPSDALLCLRV